jgi:hypothetical protein
MRAERHDIARLGLVVRLVGHVVVGLVLVVNLVGEVSLSRGLGSPRYMGQCTAI